MTVYCNNASQGKPGCLDVADPEFDMDYSDVEPGAVIHWCSNCGPDAHKIEATLQDAFRNRPGFAADFEKAVTEAETETRTFQNELDSPLEKT